MCIHFQLKILDKNIIFIIIFLIKKINTSASDESEMQLPPIIRFKIDFGSSRLSMTSLASSKVSRVIPLASLISNF